MALFRRIILQDSITKHDDYKSSWKWEKPLQDIVPKTRKEVGVHLTSHFVPVHAFREHILKEFIEQIGTEVVLEVEITEYKKITESGLRVYWIATIVKMAGYRALLRWAGANEEGDESKDFWVNIGSMDVHGIRCHDEAVKDCYLPPDWLNKRWIGRDTFQKSITNALINLNNARTLSTSFEDGKQLAYKGCRLRVGQRLELLDYNESSRVRPARVRSITGRRICVQVHKMDCEKSDDDDRQYGSSAEFWVDEASFFIFHVGWAYLNGYGVEAKKEYQKHAQKVAEAIRKGEKPHYASIDVTVEQLSSDVKRVPEHTGEKWEKGMKFELMDPLGATVRDLYVASVIEVLQNGYLRVGMDGPDCEAECIPLHCTSPLLFPVGYAEKHGIELHGPEDTEEFNWPAYLEQSSAKMAPEHLFKPDPPAERMELFKVGSRLEASDMCENVLICPATVVGHKGRLIHVHFDGWDSSFDQYFDIDSNDIFPVGWCEMHGYKLEAPKEEVVVEAKKRKK